MLVDSKAGRALVRIAETFFAQIQAFGQLGLAVKVDEEVLNIRLIDRYAFIRSYFELLEMTAGLQFTDQEVPLLFSKVNWPPGTPLGGYSNKASTVKPSQMLVSYIENWSFGWTNRRKQGLSIGRILRASLWECHHNGLAQGLAYIWNLQKYGYLLDPDEALTTIDWLLRAYCLVEHDEEIVPFFLGQTPTSNEEWIATTIQPFDMSQPVHRELPQEVFFALIDIGVEETERVRKSTSYDQWLLGQTNLGHCLGQIKSLLKRHGNDRNISLKTVLDQFEEIQADAGALLRVSRARIATCPLNASFDSFVAASILIRQKDPENWQSRVMHERCLVPYALKDDLLEEKLDPLPSEWLGLSPCLAVIYNPVILEEDSLRPWRAVNFSVDEVRNSIVTNRLLDEAEIQEPHLRATLIEEVTGANFTWNYALRELNEGSAKVPQHDERAIYEWLSTNKEAVKQLIEQWRAELILQEIQFTFEQTSQLEEEEQYHAQLVRLEAFLEKYPWFDHGHFEIGVTYDRLQQHEQALGHLITAIVINPVEPERWQSLAVVLHHLGHRDESLLARAIQEMIRAKSHGNA